MSKVILTNEVSGLGSAGDVVEVKNGYARNFLIPKGFAVMWTKGGEKQVAQIKAGRDARALATAEEAQAFKDSLQAATIRLAVKAGVGGRLFGAVKTGDVAAAVAAAAACDLPTGSTLEDVVLGSSADTSVMVTPDSSATLPSL